MKLQILSLTAMTLLGAGAFAGPETEVVRVDVPNGSPVFIHKTKEPTVGIFVHDRGLAGKSEPRAATERRTVETQVGNAGFITVPVRAR